MIPVDAYPCELSKGTNPTPQNGGQPCVGPTTVECNEQPCLDQERNIQLVWGVANAHDVVEKGSNEYGLDRKVVVDSEGAAYATVNKKSGATFNGFTPYPPSDALYVTKTDASGALVWSKLVLAGNAGDVYIALDTEEQNVYISVVAPGVFYNEINGTSVDLDGTINMLKLGATDGTYKWHQAFKGDSSANNYVKHFTVVNGWVYITGIWGYIGIWTGRETFIDFGGKVGVLTTVPRDPYEWSSVLVCLDAQTGTAEWAEYWREGIVSSVQVDAQDNIYVSGSATNEFIPPLGFPKPRLGMEGRHAYVFKITAERIPLWFQWVEGSPSSLTKLVLGTSGNELYMYGDGGAIRIDEVTMNQDNGYADTFITRLDPETGKAFWIQGYVARDINEAAVGPYGNLHVVKGAFSGCCGSPPIFEVATISPLGSFIHTTTGFINSNTFKGSSIAIRPSPPVRPYLLPWNDVFTVVLRHHLLNTI